MMNEQFGLGNKGKDLTGQLHSLLTCVRCRTPKALADFGKRTRHTVVDVCRDCKAANRARSEYYSTNLRRAFHGTLAPNETLQLIGCTTEALRAHLAQQFEPGMNWANYGRAGWHIDHLAPCAVFDLADAHQRQLCYHYTNLRPIWASANHQKSGKILPEARATLRRAGLLLAV